VCCHHTQQYSHQQWDLRLGSNTSRSIMRQIMSLLRCWQKKHDIDPYGVHILLSRICHNLQIQSLYGYYLKHCDRPGQLLRLRSRSRCNYQKDSKHRGIVAVMLLWPSPVECVLWPIITSRRSFVTILVAISLRICSLDGLAIFASNSLPGLLLSSL
jgi:hypothetical protein